jgi:hypothetical protein
MPNSKRKREKKVSLGIHGGGGKVTLSTVEKALLGKGLVQSFRPIGARREEARNGG